MRLQAGLKAYGEFSGFGYGLTEVKVLMFQVLLVWCYGHWFIRLLSVIFCDFFLISPPFLPDMC